MHFAMLGRRFRKQIEVELQSHSSISDMDKDTANLDAKTGEKRVKIDRFQRMEFVKK